VGKRAREAGRAAATAQSIRNYSPRNDSFLSNGELAASTRLEPRVDVVPSSRNGFLDSHYLSSLILMPRHQKAELSS
jgi:hypothetical protein